MSAKPRPLAEIPNTEGFRLLLIHKVTGKHWPSNVMKDANGLHYCGGENGCRKQLLYFSGWLPADAA